MKKLPLAPNGIFYSRQGEGHLRGFPMVFVRLAGCSIGCPSCDTDYSVDMKLDLDYILNEVRVCSPSEWRDRWVWITGGEPTDHDLVPLIRCMKEAGYSVAVATAGHRRFVPTVDWLSVSPHTPDSWAQQYGHEVKLVPGLNGYSIEDFLKARPDDETDFWYRSVPPLWKDGREDEASLATCLEFLDAHPNWALSRQDHKHWSLP